jgi:hypothetical protein
MLKYVPLLKTEAGFSKQERIWWGTAQNLLAKARNNIVPLFEPYFKARSRKQKGKQA